MTPDREWFLDHSRRRYRVRDVTDADFAHLPSLEPAGIDPWIGSPLELRTVASKTGRGWIVTILPGNCIDNSDAAGAFLVRGRA